MKSELFVHYGNRLKTKSKRVYRKSLKAIVKSKLAIISSSNITIHYAKEIKLQAKIFYANKDDLHRFRKQTKYDY